MNSSISKTSAVSKTRAAPVPPLQPPSGRSGSKDEEKKRPWWKQPLPIFCIALPLLIAAGLLARIGYRNIRERMQVRAAKKLQEELFSEAGRNLSDEERREKFKKLGEMRETLSPKQQSEMWAPRREAMRQEMKRFFEMTPQDQVAFLDKRIKEDDERIKRWQQMRAQGGGGGGNGGAGGATGGGGGQAGAGGSGAGGTGGGGAGGGGAGGTGAGGGGPGGGWGRGGGPGGGGGGPGGGGGGGPGGGGPPGGPGGRAAWNDPTQRQNMIKNMLDGTTPEERAQRSLFMQMMQQRRTQLGMPPSPWGPR